MHTSASIKPFISFDETKGKRFKGACILDFGMKRVDRHKRGRGEYGPGLWIKSVYFDLRSACLETKCAI